MDVAVTVCFIELGAVECLIQANHVIVPIWRRKKTRVSSPLNVQHGIPGAPGVVAITACNLKVGCVNLLLQHFQLAVMILKRDHATLAINRVSS